MTDAPRWPLSGLRVVDLTRQIGGPYATKLLADAGAGVIKVEAPDGDPLRRWSASDQALDEAEDGALFQYLNTSKRSVVLDLRSEVGRARLLDLIRDADLVFEDFAPGELEQLGLGFEVLRQGNPRLSLVSITPFGSDGPWAGRPSTEYTLQAEVGSIGYRGLPGRKPVGAGGRFGEWTVGVFASVGGLCAWLSARRTGEGQHVDVSNFESVLLTMTLYHDLDRQLTSGQLRRSIEIPSIEPAKDGWVGFSTITGQQWTDFCAMIGQQDLAEDPAYLEGYRRMQHIDRMQELIHSWTRERTIDEIIEVALLLRVPVAPVGDGRSLPQMDHFEARGVFVDNPAGFLQPRPPYSLEKTPLRPFEAAPRLGEHDREVISELEAAVPRRPPALESGDPLPFSGLKVLDLSAFWAGPVAAGFLADMGADVLKVESIQRPDGMRFAGARPGPEMWEWSPIFHGANPGKRDVTLRFDDEEGLRLVEQLIAQADVVIENFSARVLENFGLGWEKVHALNPRAIMVRMPAFGLDGPWRDRAGFAMNVEQVSGLAWITGYEDLPLVVRGACDPLGGMHAVFALIAALEVRRRTGEGQLVELPLVEVALNLAAEQVIEYSAYGELLSRSENRGPFAAPQGVYHCAEEDPEEGDEKSGRHPGELVIAVASDEQWQSLCEVLARPEWSRDPELAHASGRRARHDEIDRAIEAWLADQPSEAAAERLRAAGVPAARVTNAHHIMPNPQLEHREFYQDLVHPVTGNTRYPGFPMKFSAFGRKLHRSPPPLLGEHNESVLRDELGLSADEIEGLAERQVIGKRPSFM